MLKTLVLSVLTLFSTVPAVAMLSNAQTLQKLKLSLQLKQRGYAKMTDTDFTKLLRYEKSFPRNLPLSPKNFAHEFDAMKKDEEDLSMLFDRLKEDLIRVDGIRYSKWWTDEHYDGSLFMRCYPYYGPGSALDDLSRGTDALVKIALPLTLLLAATSVGGGFGVLIAPEVCTGVVSAMKHATFLCAKTTIAAGAFSFLLKHPIVVTFLQDLNGTNRVIKRRRAHLGHVHSLLFYGESGHCKESCCKSTNKE